ncbi:MAG: hypothetical protein ACMVP2_24095 [Imperialibacter sp.]|uniref:hypothetical protein n=1 Tax=Imperialibacter sp. TaxID=2038411 RepID=UPI0030DDA2A5|tara:strand:+ start:853 stop:1248 length:396 start_codon:yes stop_codon:yes gene_type:complete
MDYVLRKQISLLIELALSDNKFDLSEKAYLMKFASSRGAKNSEIARMINNPTPTGSLEMLNWMQKIELMVSCGKVVVADGVIEPEEQTFMYEVAKKMGFKKGVVDYLLKNVDSMPEKELKEGFLEFAGQPG